MQLPFDPSSELQTSQYFVEAECLDTTYRLPKPQICDTYYFCGKILLGHDRGKRDDSNTYKIIIFGPFLGGMRTL